MENDGVIDKVLARVNKEVKKGGKWSIQIGFNNCAGCSNLEHGLDQAWTERTRYEWIVLPDHPSCGKLRPLFFVLLTKVEVHES